MRIVPNKARKRLDAEIRLVRWDVCDPLLTFGTNIEGNRWPHVLTGHLSHQIEHHLFPDIPAARYPEMAPRVREICARYGQSYNTGSFRRQLSSVIGRIVRLSLPGPKLAAKLMRSAPGEVAAVNFACAGRETVRESSESGEELAVRFPAPPLLCLG